MNKRPAEFFLVIGAPNTGKTTWLLKILLALARGQRVLVVDPDGNEPTWWKFKSINIRDKRAMKNWTKGVRVIQLAEQDTDGYDTFDVLYNKKVFTNGVLVLDDCNTYVQANPNKHLMNLLRRKRQYSIDIFAAAHGFTEIPPKFYSFATKYTLFKTEEDPQRAKRNIDQFDRFVGLRNRVNSKALNGNPYFNMVIDKSALQRGDYDHLAEQQPA